MLDYIRVDISSSKSEVVAFLPDNAPLPEGDYCSVCSVWMHPDFGCRHGLLLAHSLCCQLCPLTRDPQPALGSRWWWHMVKTRMQLRTQAWPD